MNFSYEHSKDEWSLGDSSSEYTWEQIIQIQTFRSGQHKFLPISFDLILHNKIRREIWNKNLGKYKVNFLVFKGQVKLILLVKIALIKI